MLSLKSKLRACKHINTNAYRYVRDDGSLEDQIYAIQDGKLKYEDMRMTYMEFCLDCGATKRYHKGEFPHKAEWLAPWLWRL